MLCDLPFFYLLALYFLIDSARILPPPLAQGDSLPRGQAQSIIIRLFQAEKPFYISDLKPIFEPSHPYPDKTPETIGG